MFEINNSLNAENILNDDSLRFFEKFINSFEERRKDLLEKRKKLKKKIKRTVLYLMIYFKIIIKYYIIC